MPYFDARAHIRAVQDAHDLAAEPADDRRGRAGARGDSEPRFRLKSRIARFGDGVGILAERLSAVTPSTRVLPAAWYGSAEVAVTNESGTCPASMSTMAGPAPL